MGFGSLARPRLALRPMATAVVGMRKSLPTLTLEPVTGVVAIV